ncbi:putative short chain dehydrogenase/ reductase [Hypoxylon sp. FL0543]|nr:putative short chain dehydrogenase/ reductase [Hypoxylon sp. FL0543]
MSQTPFTGKLFAITGAASGIGRTLAGVLFAQGALLSLADVNEKALSEVKAELLHTQKQQRAKTGSGEINGAAAQPEVDKDVLATIFTAVVDVRSQDACNNWIEATVSHFGQPLSGAANLAGVIGQSITQDKGSIRNITDEEFDWVMQVNVKGTLNSLRAELPHTQVGRDGRGGGSIVNASSVSGLSGIELNGPYVAAKHSIVGLTRTAAKEEGQRAIRVNAVAPGIIATPMMKQIEASKGSTELFSGGDPGALARKGDAEEVAQVIAFLLGPHSSFVSGVVLPIDGGWLC